MQAWEAGIDVRKTIDKLGRQALFLNMQMYVKNK